MTADKKTSQALTLGYIFDIYWPLGISWIFMGVGQPAMGAILARLQDPEIHLAAFGGVVFPITLLLAFPITMLLPASTALSKDMPSYFKLRRFLYAISLITTTAHILIAFTPLYYLVIEHIIGAPAEIIEPARIGLMITTPWSGFIAYRRFQQGILIRFGRTGAITIGAAIRVVFNILILMIGFWIGSIPGIIIGTLSMVAGIVLEAIYTGFRVQPLLKNELTNAPQVKLFTWKEFSNFYTPLALTALLQFLWQPLTSAALSRMPLAIQSLAVLPILNGLTFMLRALGIAYKEVVISLLEKPCSAKKIQQFAIRLFGSATLLHFIIIITPLSRLWFYNLSGLKPALSNIAVTGMWLMLPATGLFVIQNWLQGIILYSRHTRGIPESLAFFLFTEIAILYLGIKIGNITGLYVGSIAFSFATLIQTCWLWFRSRQTRISLKIRDSAKTSPVSCQN